MNKDSWRQAPGVQQAPTAVVDFVADVAADHGLFECAKGLRGEVGLAPAPDAYAALYVGPHGMSLALDPADAATFSRRCNLLLHRTSNRTHYLRVPAARLDQATLPELRKAADLAVERSWHGPRWQRGTGSGGAALEASCPTHPWYRLAVNGFCSDFDDIAPDVSAAG